MFRTTDICTIAIQIERNGERTYLQAAAAASDPIHAAPYPIARESDGVRHNASVAIAPENNTMMLAKKSDAIMTVLPSLSFQMRIAMRQESFSASADIL